MQKYQTHRYWNGLLYLFNQSKARLLPAITFRPVKSSAEVSNQLLKNMQEIN